MPPETRRRQSAAPGLGTGRRAGRRGLDPGCLSRAPEAGSGVSARRASRPHAAAHGACPRGVCPSGREGAHHLAEPRAFLRRRVAMMRRILVDHAREHRAAKRPGAGVKVTLDDHIGAVQPPDCEILLLDSALTDLSRHRSSPGSHRRAAVLRRTVRAGSGVVVVAVAGDRDARMANRAGVDVPAHDEDGQTGD